LGLQPFSRYKFLWNYMKTYISIRNEQLSSVLNEITFFYDVLSSTLSCCSKLTGLSFFCKHILLNCTHAAMLYFRLHIVIQMVFLLHLSTNIPSHPQYLIPFKVVGVSFKFAISLRQCLGCMIGMFGDLLSPFWRCSKASSHQFLQGLCLNSFSCTLLSLLQRVHKSKGLGVNAWLSRAIRHILMRKFLIWHY